MYQRFPAAVAGSADLQESSYSNFNHVLSTSRLSIRKRAVPALAAFVAICPQRFEQIKVDLANGFAAGGDSAKAWVAAVGGIAKTSAAPAIGTLIAEGGLLEAILKQTEDVEDSDAVEGALTVGMRRELCADFTRHWKSWFSELLPLLLLTPRPSPAGHFSSSSTTLYVPLRYYRHWLTNPELR